MLVLSRRVGETVVIEGDIRVTVVSVTGNKVRLGITAPEGVRVDRLEVHNRIAELVAPAGPGEADHPSLVSANHLGSAALACHRSGRDRPQPYGKK
jgi:carbon storage regulator